MSSRPDYPFFDADNHYYEALDAFTRHVPAEMRRRCVEWAEIEGRRYHVVGGRVSHAVRNATFNPISKPGSLYDFLRGNPTSENVVERLWRDAKLIEIGGGTLEAHQKNLVKDLSRDPTRI